MPVWPRCRPAASGHGRQWREGGSLASGSSLLSTVRNCARIRGRHRPARSVRGPASATAGSAGVTLRQPRRHGGQPAGLASGSDHPCLTRSSSQSGAETLERRLFPDLWAQGFCLPASRWGLTELMIPERSPGGQERRGFSCLRFRPRTCRNAIATRITAICPLELRSNAPKRTWSPAMATRSGSGRTLWPTLLPARGGGPCREPWAHPLPGTRLIAWNISGSRCRPWADPVLFPSWHVLGASAPCTVIRPL